jgi:hypothetical protein
MSNIVKQQARAFWGRSPGKSLCASLYSSLFGLIALTSLSGCGQQPFMATPSVDALSAPGSVVIPAKADILLVEDDTGSMNEIYPQIQGAMPNVLKGLEANGWDYHFATIPLTTFRPIQEAAGSQYDGNSSPWVSPFPGALQYGPGTLASWIFRTADSYDGYLHKNEIIQTNGTEWGLDNIVNSVMSMQSDGTNFLRDDAMLVIMVVGNGNDTSRVNYCARPGDGTAVPCDTLGMPSCSTTDISQWGAPGATCSSGALSLGYYTSLLKSLKPSSAMIRFYAAVSAETVTGLGCQGANATPGYRYQSVASALNGKSYDICSGQSAVTASLGALANDLQNVHLSLRTRFLPISQRADASTIVVTRDDGVVIPQSSTNGWTYSDSVITNYQIDYPVPMNQFSGYAVELHGNYKLIGNQTATVSYTPYGLHSSN